MVESNVEIMQVSKSLWSVIMSICANMMAVVRFIKEIRPGKIKLWMKIQFGKIKLWMKIQLNERILPLIVLGLNIAWTFLTALLLSGLTYYQFGTSLRDQSFTSLMEDLRQDINRVFFI